MYLIHHKKQLVIVYWKDPKSCTHLEQRHADPCWLAQMFELLASIKHQSCGSGLLQAECVCRQVTGTAYDSELFLEQEALMGGQPPSPPRAALDVPIPLQRSQTEHEASLTAATRQGVQLYSKPLRHAEF